MAYLVTGSQVVSNAQKPRPSNITSFPGSGTLQEPAEAAIERLERRTGWRKRDAASDSSEPEDSEAPEFRQPHELTSATSLKELHKAILGNDADRVDDRSFLVETVEAQLQALRAELGIVEPVPTPPPEPTLSTVETAVAEEVEPEAAQPAPAPGRLSAVRRMPELFKQVAGLARGRGPHSFVLMATAASWTLMS
jgi:hypothetical protein